MENTQPTPEQESAAIGDAVVDTAEMEALSQMLAENETKLAEMRELVLRERAEIDNQRKRMQRELETTRRFASEKLLTGLLPVCDHLERGLAADKGEATGLRAGVELTLRELLRVTEAHGLVVIDPLGEPFDPERHEAMNMVETREHPAGTVVAVLQKGYLLHERLLRPAMVSVAQAPA